MEIETIKDIIYLGLSSSSDLLLIFDETGKIVFANQAAALITDFSPDDLTQRFISALESKLEPELSKKIRERTLELSEIFRGISPRRKRDGTIVYLHETIVPVNLNGKKFFVLIGRDVKSEAMSSLQVNPMASFDVVTGFLRMSGFTEVLAAEIYGGKRRRVNLLALDICHFSSIRLAYGLDFARRLLQGVAQRLKERLPNDFIFCSTEKDEFLIALLDVRREELGSFVKQILDLFNEPFVVDNKKMVLTVNLGVCSFPSDAKDVRDLIDKAFITLEQAKKMGENAYLVYSKEIDAFVRKYIATREEIIGALYEDRVIPYGQLIFSVSDKSVKGIEILSRVIMKDGSVTSPGTFVSLFEETGLIFRLDDILFEAIKKASSNLKDIFVSVNVSPVSAKNPETIDKLNILKSHLEVPLYCEIMETSLLDEDTLAFLKKLREADIKVAVDDFGRGYNSLSYLRHFALDMVKIDMDFIANISADPRTFTIVNSIVDLCRKLQIRTCAEGVETKDQAKVLNLLMCDLAQGFYFSKPAPLKVCIEQVSK